MAAPVVETTPAFVSSFTADSVYRVPMFSRALIAALLLLAMSTFAQTTQQAMDARQDVWADAALAQPGGPTYDFFVKLLPPLRYVDAQFHHYPITLSAPGALVKARLVSNGLAINALARQPTWKGEA